MPTTTKTIPVNRLAVLSRKSKQAIKAAIKVKIDPLLPVDTCLSYLDFVTALSSI
tara:strand:- start:170112 stop:170276 length:165 start_codon:yes stop_codon:yes gene_type:complete